MFHKIILLGESRVGKTTLRRSYMGESTKVNYIKTIGVDFAFKKTDEGGFQIWDIAGESTPNTIRSHLRSTSGIIFIFDVMQPDTLDKLSDWVDTTIDVLGTNLYAALVGNKIDLRTDEEGLIKEDVSWFIDNLKSRITGKVKYFETSALTSSGVDDIFDWFLKTLRRDNHE